MGIQINGQTDTIKAIDGTMTMPGTVTYEDVSRINVVGVVTAASFNSSTGNVTITENANVMFQNSARDTNRGAIQFNDSGDFRVRSGALLTETLRIKSTGEINIKGTQPTIELYEATDTYGWDIFRNSADARLKFQYDDGGTTSIPFTITPTSRIGIGEDSPDGLLVIKGDSNAASNPSIRLKDGSDIREAWITNASGDLILSVGGDDNVAHATLKMFESGVFDYAQSTGSVLRIDSSGRLLVGTISDTSAARFIVQGLSSDVNAQGVLDIRRGTRPDGSSDTEIGSIRFKAIAGDGRYAQISAFSDGASGSDSDTPGSLRFSTTPDGSSGATERMTIYSSGQTTIAHDTSTVKVLRPEANSTSYASDVLQVNCARSASTAYSLFKALSGNLADVEFKLDGNGIGYSDGGWTTPASDYAEFFEWVDGNPNNEDRRGVSVVLDGNRIREAIAGEDPLGVISSRPSIVGDAATEHWKEKHLTDQFGSYIIETHNVVSWKDEDGKTHSYEDWNIPADVVVPDDAVIAASDENGIPFTHRKLNPDYDPNQSYISRADRPEWDVVGLLGKLRMHKGQVTGSRWIKMRDISDSVEEWLVR
jgi:hypothetical protein